MSLRSLWNQVSTHAENCWTGNPDMNGSAVGVMAEGAGMIPGAGDVGLPDGQESSAAVNRWLGNGPHRQTQGNIGNRIGTVVGGLGGAASGLIVPGGLGGAAAGMALGSQAGGWIADQF